MLVRTERSVGCAGKERYARVASDTGREITAIKIKCNKGIGNAGSLKN